VLHPIVVFAQHGQIGTHGSAAEPEGHGVVDFAASCRVPAAGPPAVLISRAYVVGERRRRLVPLRTEVDDLGAGRIGQDPAPPGVDGDRAGDLVGDR
jgi:hypothetical protein